MLLPGIGRVQRALPESSYSPSKSPMFSGAWPDRSLPDIPVLRRIVMVGAGFEPA